MKYISAEGRSAAEIARRVLDTLKDNPDVPDVVLIDSMSEIDEALKAERERKELKAIIVTTGMERREASQKLVHSVAAWGLAHAAEPEYYSDEKPWEKFRDAPNRRKRK